MTQTEYKIYIDKIVERIERARILVSEHHIVKVVAVSKYVDTEAVKSLYEIGQRAFGENKVQDMKLKMDVLDDLPLEWHFIGSLQKNKINQLIDLDPFLMQSLHSLELAQALDKRLEAKGKTMECLLQINSAKEETKSGVMPEEAGDVYAQIAESCPRIDLRGVMSIGAHTENNDHIKQSFETTRKIFDGLKGAEICSMGMSGDFELAIACGSTIVRLGSLLFPGR
ncbi:YggS family pyridoxal phosphate-dependent enzyme [Sulfurimonas sp. HSL-3221]|uniref:YggS family pyridoxal phosphate-dependent enzyme n=1 Tax=Sulfurimonadaceae TaxID=2771471 RepID=UPI001E4F41D8|nr:YggS family pyridoxal phosphate-dependent enzyme [Sulfurimonas sp. HSL-3221]UFS63366.1 YggS family pyridoxal phosphate-dependent enzyme [Sulfurimonas sp. HSL-3221]